MSIRRFARVATCTYLSRTAPIKRVLKGLLCVAALAAALPALAAGQATLDPLQPQSGTISVNANSDVSLSAVKKLDGLGMAGEKVDWSATGPGGFTLTPTASTTSGQTATDAAGVAVSVFHAKTLGQYVVTATTQKNPGCGTPGCASWVSTRYSVTVAAPAADESSTTTSSAHISGGEVIGVAAVVGAGIALAANQGNDHNGPAVLRTLTSAGGDGQSANANAPLAQPLLVHAANNGASVGSVAIRWTATGGAVLSAPLSFTNADGIAGIQVRSVGPGPGPDPAPTRRRRLRHHRFNRLVFFRHTIFAPRKRKPFITTLTELNAIAPLAITGLN